MPTKVDISGHLHNPVLGYREADRMLMAANGAAQLVDAKLELFHAPNFLEPALCGELIAAIEQHRTPSTIADDIASDPRYRTSETCHFPATFAPSKLVEQRISAFMGLPLEYGEPLQGQRYAEGQEFKQHTDYFEPTSSDYLQHCAARGQRTWTAMIYLNEPLAGGATQFNVVGETVQPETGKIVVWNNRRRDGSLNPASLHIGMTVLQGLKYVITKWYRERPC